jgi:hypothetical protein
LVAESNGQFLEWIVTAPGIRRGATLQKVRGRHVSDTRLPSAGKLVAGGLDDMTAGRNFMSSHLRGELVQVMSRVRPEDLSAVEITALLVILRPADSRVLGLPAGRPQVRVLRDSRRAPGV